MRSCGWRCTRPASGYYSAGRHEARRGGDFVTAPEVSSLFSRCLARQSADVLRDTGGDVLELGAGSGRMAADVLTELAALDCLPARYLILEVSADLAERQRERLVAAAAELSRRVQWLDRWPEPPIRGVVLANEVLDAMPVERFVLRAQPGGIGVCALGVAVEGDRFVWRETSPTPELDACRRRHRRGAAGAAARRLCVRSLPVVPAVDRESRGASRRRAWRC